MNKIKILIVEDHPLMRQALEIAILTQSDLEIVGRATNGVIALQILSQIDPDIEPDVILMDLLMPKMGGQEAIPLILATQPDARILVITSVDDENEIMKAVQAGVAGYLTKSAEREEIVAAIRAVHAGEPYFPQHITAKLLKTVRQDTVSSETTPKISTSLTPREKDVLDLLA